jgi:predicted transcriptional regulator YheO
MADLEEIQKAMEKKRDERRKAEEERRQLVQKGRDRGVFDGKAMGYPTWLKMAQSK